MAHKRKEIRAYIKTELAELAGMAAKVFSNRPTPTWDVELPALFVYTLLEGGEPTADNGPSPSKRKLSLAIEVRVQADENLDDTIDDLAELVEGKITADPTLGGNAARASYVSTEIDVAAQGERPIGAARLTYEVEYLY